MHVDELIAERVAIQAGGLDGGGDTDGDVFVLEEAHAAEDGIAGGREIERAQVARLEGAVEGRLVGRARNRLGRDDRRRRVPVVEQR